MKVSRKEEKVRGRNSCLSILIFLIIISFNAKAEFWTKTNGPYGGTILNFVASPQKILAASPSSIYSSNDGGDTWSKIDFPNTSIFELVRCGDGKLYASCVSILMVSDDNGSTWTNIANGLMSSANIKYTRRLNSGKVISIAHRSHQYNKLFLYDSINKTWSMIPDAAGLHLCMEYSPATNNLFIGSYQQGIFRSDNDGNSFTYCGLDTNSVINIHIDSRGWIYAGTYNNGVFYSTNNGNSWNHLLPDLDFVSAVYSDGTGAIFVGTNFNGIYKSDNDGQSWVQANNGLVDKYSRTFCKTTQGSILLGQNWAGAFKWKQATTSWADVSEGLSPIGIIDIAKLNNNEVYVSANNKGIFYSSNSGQSWALRCNGLPLGNYSKIALNSSGNVFTVSQNGGVYLSTNKGISWNCACQPQSTPDLGAYVINTANNNQFMGFSNQGILKSTDGGTTWVQKGPAGLTVKDFAFATQSIGVAVTSEQGIYKSTDGGEIWSLVSSPTGSYLSAGYAGNNVFYAGGNEGTIYKSTDAGNTWQAKGNAVSPVNDFSFSGSDKVYASTDGNGVYLSLDAGEVWNNYVLGLQGLNMNCVAAVNDTVTLTGNDDALYTTSSVLPQLTKPVLISPDNSAKNQILNPKLVWSSVTNATGYKYVISTMPDFSSVTEQNTVQDTTVQIQTSLDYGVLYYWKVCAVTDISEGAYSQARSFSTLIVSPVLISPADKTTGIGMPLIFKWHFVRNAGIYHVQLAEDIDFKKIIVEKDIEKDTIYEQEKLSSFKKYYWRVKALNDNAESKYSAAWDFETGMQPPQLLAPENHYYSIDQSVQLIWSKVNEAEYYITETYNKENFTGADLVSRDTCKGDTSITKKYNYGAVIYWRVKASANGKETGWSDVRGFSIGEKGPELLLPENNSSGLDKQIMLVWQKISNADFYEVNVATDNGFDNIIFNGESGSDTARLSEELIYGGTYYWRVRTSKSSKLSFWSDIWRFSLGAKPPVLRLPENNKTGFQQGEEFSWDIYPGAIAYEIQIALDSGFTNIIETKNDLSQRKFVSGKLDMFRRYFWRVRVILKDKNSLWSNTWSFETGIGNPVLTKPFNNAKEVPPEKVELKWEPVVGAEYYRLCLANDKDFQSIICSRDTVLLNYYEVADLEKQKHYWWRVKALCELGESQWSAPFTFETGDRTAVGDDNKLNIISVNVYPNPFNSAVQFYMQSQKSGMLKLRICSMTGLVLDELRIDFTESNSNSVNWAPGNLVPGIYMFYIMDLKDGILFTGKLVKVH